MAPKSRGESWRILYVCMFVMTVLLLLCCFAIFCPWIPFMRECLTLKGMFLTTKNVGCMHWLYNNIYKIKKLMQWICSWVLWVQFLLRCMWWCLKWHTQTHTHTHIHANAGLRAILPREPGLARFSFTPFHTSSLTPFHHVLRQEKGWRSTASSQNYFSAPEKLTCIETNCGTLLTFCFWCPVY